MADDRVDVSISVSSDKAEQGSAAAAEAMTRAVTGIQQQLDKLVATAQQSSNAMAGGFAQMSKAVNESAGSIAQAVRSNMTVVDDYGNEVEAAGARVSRVRRKEIEEAKEGVRWTARSRSELIVLAHEMAMGNFKRFGGSVMVLMEQMDLMHKIMSPLGVSIGLVAGALAIMAHAAYTGYEQMNKLKDSLVLTGNYAGITGGQFIEMGNQIAEATGSKIGVARDALAAVAATGRFTGAALVPVATAVSNIGKYSSQSAEEVAKAFSKMDEGVYKFAVSYNQAYHFATMAQLEHIRALEEQGKKEEAEAEVANLVIQKQREIAGQVDQLPGLLTRAANAWHKFWDEAQGIGRPVTVEDRITNLRQDIENEVSTFGPHGYNGSADQKRAELRRLLQQRDQGQAYVQERAHNEEVQSRGALAVQELRSQWRGLGGDVHLANEEIDQFRLKISDAQAAAKASGDALPKDVQYMIDNQAKIEANIRKKYDRGGVAKAPKGAETLGGLESNNNAQAQADLNVLKEKLKEEQDELDRSYKMQEVPLRDYYARRLDITTRGMDAEIKVVQAQLDRSKSIAASKASTPADRLSALTREIELEGRLQVMEMQRADAVRKSGQEEQAAAEAQSRALEDLEVKRTTAAVQEATKRATILAEEDRRMGLISAQQLFQMRRQFEEQETAAEIAGLQHRLDTEKELTVQARKQILDQIAALRDADNTRALEESVQLTQQQMQAAEQAATSIEDGFARAFGNFVDGTQTAREAFTQFVTQIDQMLVQLVSKKMFQQLFETKLDSSGDSVNGWLTNGLGWLTGAHGGDSGGSTGATVAHTTAVTTDTTSLAAMTAAVEAATAALATLAAAASAGGAGGLGGLSGAGGGLGGLFGEGTGGSNAWGFTMPDGSAGDIMPADLGGNAWGFTMPSFDTGTPYVPHDMVAQIHQGEAIVPAHLNSPYNPGSTTVHNQFVLPGGVDLRTQSQIAGMAGMSIQQALRRNG